MRELEPGPAWRARFEAMWPSYEAWYLQQGDAARPNYPACRAALERHMPELVPTYERVVELAGGGDLAARLLSLYRPPGFVVGLLAGRVDARLAGAGAQLRLPGRRAWRGSST